MKGKKSHVKNCYIALTNPTTYQRISQIPLENASSMQDEKTKWEEASSTKEANKLQFQNVERATAVMGVIKISVKRYTRGNGKSCINRDMG